MSHQPSELSRIFALIAAGVPDDDILLTTNEAASWANFSPLSLKKWGHDVPHVKAGRFRRYRLTTVKQLAAGEIQPGRKRRHITTAADDAAPS